MKTKSCRQVAVGLLYSLVDIWLTVVTPGFHQICQILDPSFDLGRLVMKVPATWEGFQASRRLKCDGIKTLATTLFTMEQAILAGEAGCISISPFAHELRAHYDSSYRDAEPVIGLFLQAQQYYKQHGIPTKVKSCAFMTTEEIISMAGVDAMTLPAEVLEELASTTDLEQNLEARSVFHASAQDLPLHTARLTRESYINDKAKFMRVHTTNGRGKAKTEDVSTSFRAIGFTQSLHFNSPLPYFADFKSKRRR